MKVKEIVDVYGRKLTINEDTQKVYVFNNKNKKITYNANIIEDGKVTKFWTEYVEEGVVEDIETKMNTFGNVIKATYAKHVGYDSEKNDPEKTIWKKYIKEVEENPTKYFTKDGDWKQRITLNDSLFD